MSNPHGVVVEFYSEPVEFKAESEAAGRPIYKDLPFVRIQTPGDRNNVLETKATEHYQRRFPREWMAFQASGGQTSAIGTPLSQWPPVSRSQAKEAEFFGVKTVEQLSAMSDSNCQRLGMGWMGLRDQARAYIEAAEGNSATSKLAAENEKMRADLEALKAQMAAQFSDAEPAKRGRPRKEEVTNDPT